MKAKKLLSAILAFCITFGCAVTSFATNDGAQHLEFGALEEGRNLICECDNAYDSIDDLYVRFDISIPSDGYYLLKYGTPHTDMCAEIVNTFDYTETIYEDYMIQRVYCLEKGNYELNVDIYSTAADVFVYWEFLGENITDISYGYDLIYDCDFWIYDEYNGKQYFATYADAIISFSSGKEYRLNKGFLTGTIDSEYSEGSNNLTIAFLGKSFSTIANIYPISNYIEDISISNIESYYDDWKVYFNDYDCVYPYGEIITVTFTDSSTKNFTYDSSNTIDITIPNGGCYELYIFANYDPYENNNNLDCHYDIYVSGVIVKSYHFEGTKASAIENIDSFRNQLNDILNFITENISQLFSGFTNGDFFSYLSELISLIFGLSGVFSNLYI